MQAKSWRLSRSKEPQQRIFKRAGLIAGTFFFTNTEVVAGYLSTSGCSRKTITVVERHDSIIYRNSIDTVKIKPKAGNRGEGKESNA
ncbi:MAG: hypothetical protein II734_02235, partial [Paludibacteraceae bacterium]|nr:hypothetical protein [Paludibacteraceae bacterium]